MKEIGSVVREILDKIGDGILFIDRDNNIVFANRALLQICGLEEQEVIGQKCYGLFYQSFMPCQKKDPSVVCSRDEVFRTGRAVSATHTHKMQDGTEKVFDITASPIMNEKGEVIQVLEILRDMTEKKKVEEALQESEKRLRTIIELEPECVKLVALDGTLLEMNPAGMAIIGAKSKGHICGKSIYNLILPQDRDRYRAMHESVRSGETIKAEFRIVTLDGRKRYMESHSVPWRDSSGNITAVLSVVRDITERKQAEESLRESEDRFRRLSEASLEGIAITEKGKLLDVSKKFAEMFGYKHSEMIGIHVSKLVAPEYRDFVMQKILSEYEKPFESVCVKKDGTLFPIEASGKTTHYKGRVARVTALRDITERKQAEEELRRYTERLRILSEIDHAIITTQSTDKIARIALSRIIELVPARRVSLSLFDFDAEEVTVFAVHAAGKTKVGAGKRFSLKDFGIAKEILKGKMYVVEDISSVSPLSLIDKNLKAEGIRSYTMIPLYYQGELIGSLNMGKNTTGAFAPEAITIANEVADLLAMAIRSKRTEESLRESERKYRNLVDNALIGVYKTNVKGNILYVNNALTNMLEFESPEEMMKKDVLTRYKNVKDRDVLIRSLKEKGRVTNFNIEILTKTERTISVLLSAALDGDTISGMIMDVTEQRRVEKIVRESETFLSSIFEGIQDGVVVLDRDFRILFANSSYVEQVGSLSSDIKGKHCYGVLYNRDEPCYSAGVKCSVKKVFETGLSSTEIRKKGGNHIEIIVYPLKDSSGKVISVVEIRRDVTKNMQLNEEVKKRVRELEEFYDMAVGRELKMVELKEEVERLKKALRKYKT